MSRKGRVFTCMLVSVFFIVSSVASFSAKPLARTVSGVLYVGGSGPGNYTSVQSAIDDAAEGDLVLIYPGTYSQPLHLLKSLTIQGVDRATTIIDGLFAQTTMVVHTNNFMIRNLTFRGSDWIDIGIQSSMNGTIRDCDLGYPSHVNRRGIALNDSQFITIQHCTIHGYEDGVYAEAMTYCTITDCVFTDNRDGIELSDNSSGCSITRCKITGGPLVFMGINILRSSDTIISNCTVKDCHIGMYSWNSNRTWIVDSTFYNISNIGVGLLDDSHGDMLWRCTISYCALDGDQSAIVSEGSGTGIHDYLIKENGGSGITIIGLTTVTGSTIAKNGFVSKTAGIQTFGLCRIYTNNFLSNYIQAYDISKTGNWSFDGQGNFWDDYHGQRWTRDLIGRRPYRLHNNSNRDDAPLMCPYNPEGPSVRILRPDTIERSHLYILGLRVFRFPYTLLLGPCRIKALAVDYVQDSVIDKVEFYVDGTLRHTDKRAPYTWTWIVSKKLQHSHTITAIVYDHQGRTSSDTIVVRKFL
jgi:parallel beta-helix repeat protein